MSFECRFVHSVFVVFALVTPVLVNGWISGDVTYDSAILDVGN